MVIFLVLSGGVFLQLVYEETKDTIHEQYIKIKSNLLTQLVPAHLYNNQPLTDIVAITVPNITKTSTINLHIFRKDNQIIAIAMPVVARGGYSGDIEILVGMYINGTIAGIRIIKHSETPGIGDAIHQNKTDWVLQFSDKTIKPLSIWQLKKNGGKIDALTGATISTQAVTRTVKKALVFLDTNKHLYQ